MENIQAMNRQRFFWKRFQKHRQQKQNETNGIISNSEGCTQQRK